MTPEAIYAKIKDLPGWFELEEIKALKALKVHAAPVIVECGTYCGRSAWAFYYLWSNARIITHDPVDEPDRTLPPEAVFHLVKGAESRYKNEIDILFIDDDHTYDTIYANVERFRHQLRDGGYIVFHDYFFETDDVAGVRRFVDELGGCDFSPGKYGLAIWKK